MKSVLRSCSTMGMAICVMFAAIALVPVRTEAASIIHVDDDATQGGNGTRGRPFQTIQEGIESLGSEGGTVLIEPGTYYGPIVVDRSNVTLRGDASPIYEGDFLVGFDDDVVITIDRDLEDPGPSDNEPEDLIELRGSNNEVHNVVVDTQGMFEGLNSAVSAKAEGEDFYTNIVLSHIIIEGDIDTGVWTRKANAVLDFITAVQGGIHPGGVVGVFPDGIGHVEINRADLANWRNSVCVFGLTDPLAENEPTNITTSLSNSRLRDAADAALRLVGQGAGLVNPDAPLIMEVVAEGNTFQDSRFSIVVQPVRDAFLNTARRDLILHVDDNTYIGITPGPGESDPAVTFHSQGLVAGSLVRDTTIVVEDGDGIFPDPATINVGGAPLGNSYVLEVVE